MLQREKTLQTSSLSRRKMKQMVIATFAVIGLGVFLASAWVENESINSGMHNLLNPFNLQIEPQPVKQEQDSWRLGA